MTAQKTAPARNTRAAAFAGGHPEDSTVFTVNGESNSPTLPPLAMSPFAHAPAANHRTAINSRKVVLAVSKMPAITARRRSHR